MKIIYNHVRKLLVVSDRSNKPNKIYTNYSKNLYIIVTFNIIKNIDI